MARHNSQPQLGSVHLANGCSAGCKALCRLPRPLKGGVVVGGLHSAEGREEELERRAQVRLLRGFQASGHSGWHLGMWVPAGLRMAVEESGQQAARLVPAPLQAKPDLESRHGLQAEILIADGDPKPQRHTASWASVSA